MSEEHVCFICGGTGEEQGYIEDLQMTIQRTCYYCGGSGWTPNPFLSHPRRARLGNIAKALEKAIKAIEDASNGDHKKQKNHL